MEKKGVSGVYQHMHIIKKLTMNNAKCEDRGDSIESAEEPNENELPFWDAEGYRRKKKQRVAK